MYEHHEPTTGQAIAALIIGIIVWIVIFYIVKKVVNRKITSQKKIKSATSEFNEKFFEELQFSYQIMEIKNGYEITSNNLDDLITNGKILIELQNIGTDKKITMTYSRKLKGIGFVVILFSIMLCYIGVIIPYFIMQGTKNNALRDMERIFQTAVSIN